ncbi:hypothetical protein [uncultured Maritimibacter sp.]|uniref:hypothetical protein n=1 Tax=uncultured Maritimibacter sp. TaxID=991866 RepID=UPI002597E52C|nr:hypothetical protein [uncultured Maritimibacter sp.]
MTTENQDLTAALELLASRHCVTLIGEITDCGVKIVSRKGGLVSVTGRSVLDAYHRANDALIGRTSA